MSGDRKPDAVRPGDERPGAEEATGTGGAESARPESGPGEESRSEGDGPEDGRHEERRGPRGGDGPGAGPRGEDGKRAAIPLRGRAGNGPEPDGGPDLLGLDEQALRTLLHDAVREVEPSPGSLEHLRVAVPARRARRRQMTVGAVAAALVVGIATPALMQSGVVSRVLDGSTTSAASSHDQDGGSQAGVQGGGSARQDGDGGPGDGAAAPSESAGPSGGSDSPSPDTNDTLGPTSPSCLRSQLGDGGTTLEAPGAGGQVYGSFRITNISDSPCKVKGPDTVSAAVTGTADPSGVSVVDHTPGDRADRLPDPRLEPRSIILEPGQSYVVRFAWVPNGGTCPTAPGPAPEPGPGGDSGDGGSGGTGPTGGSGGAGETGGSGGTGGTDPTGGSGGTGETGGSGGTDPTGAGGATGSGGGEAGEGGDIAEEPPASGPSPQLLYDGTPGGPPATSVVLRYVPAAGEPRIGNVEIAGACAGTVYRTGPIMVP